MLGCSKICDGLEGGADGISGSVIGCQAQEKEVSVGEVQPQRQGAAAWCGVITGRLMLSQKVGGLVCLQTYVFGLDLSKAPILCVLYVSISRSGHHSAL